MHRSLSWTAVLPLIVLAAGCSDEGSSGGAGDGGAGSCGELQYGEWQVTGEPRVDNIFRALLIVDAQSRAIEARTIASVDRLAETFGLDLDPDTALADNAALVAAAMESALGEHIDWAGWGAGPCVADFALAQEAQAQCEAHRGCDVSTDLVPGPVDCEGACLGSCEGDCSGECLTPIADEICAGTCYGACNTPMACDGDCYGDCSGECFAMNNHGCAGPCEGTCEGICETTRGAACGGNCTGLCGVEITADEMCVGDCRGACDGGCTGECVGQAFAWPAGSGAECDATADCSGPSKLLSWAAPRATWIDYAVFWSPATDDDSVAIAELAYQFGALEDEMQALIAANAELEALVAGDDGFGVESPASAFGETVQGLAADGPDALDLPAGTEECFADALGAAGEILPDVANRATSTLPAQIELLAVIAAD